MLERNKAIAVAVLECRSLGNVGKEYGISRARVSQVTREICELVSPPHDPWNHVDEVRELASELIPRIQALELPLPPPAIVTPPHWLDGLPLRAKKAIIALDCHDRDEVREAMTCGALDPGQPGTRNFGFTSWIRIRNWLENDPEQPAKPDENAAQTAQGI